MMQWMSGQLDCQVMEERGRKRNASLTTRALNKEDPDSIRGNGRRLDEIWIRCDLCQLFQFRFEVLEFLRYDTVAIEERKTVDIELLAF